MTHEEAPAAHPDRVRATPAALALVRSLGAQHGELTLVLSHGCCDGSTPMCLKRGELSPGPGDVLLGEVGGVPFWTARTQLEAIGDVDVELDVGSGSVGSFALEDAEGLHFKARYVPHPPAAAHPTAPPGPRPEAGDPVPARTATALPPTSR